MKRLWNWLKAEWALGRKQANCPHADMEPGTYRPCSQCGYQPLWEYAG